MMSPDPKLPEGKVATAADASRIYILPNLMTAGNLFCGFLAVIRCIQAKFASESASYIDFFAAEKMSASQLYEQAVWFILAAVVFDSLDGRLARLGGRESLFGKEFDSIADTVSFGMAPALMVFFLILSPTENFLFFREAGWLIGFIYLLCASVRLSRFNVITHPAIHWAEGEHDDDFVGLPAPAAAGMIASLVLVLNRSDGLKDFAIFLPALLLLIAGLMVSEIRYPSFKSITWTTELRFQSFIATFLLIVFIFWMRSYAVALLFLLYIFFGLGRSLARAVRKKRGQPVSSSVKNL